MTINIRVSHLTEVDSSVIEKVGYSNKTSTLYVQFHNGTISSYSANVYTYTSLVNARSVGSYYNSYIKNILLSKGPLYGSSLVLDQPAVAAAAVNSAVGTYKILVSVKGEMTLEVDASNFAEAVAKANSTLAASIKDAKYEVLSVKKV